MAALRRPSDPRRGSGWAFTVATLALLAATLLVALFFLRSGTLGGQLDQPAQSVSDAPGP